MKEASRTSPETEGILRPKSAKKVAVEESVELKVSTAIDWKRWDWRRSVYLADFLEAASSAASPAERAACYYYYYYYTLGKYNPEGV